MRKNQDYMVTALGVALLVLGLFLIKEITDPQGFMTAFPYICVGIGCGAFGHGLGNILSKKAFAKDKKAQKQMEIEKNDERNIAVACHAKARAFDSMTFVFGALLLTFALMEVDLIPLLLLVAAYLFVHGQGIYYRSKFEREM